MFKYTVWKKIKLILSITTMTGTLCIQDYIKNKKTVKQLTKDLSNKVKASVPDKYQDKIQQFKSKKQQFKRKTKQWIKEKQLSASENTKTALSIFDNMSQQLNQEKIQLKDHQSPKKQSLMNYHLIFGGLSMLGSIFMPKSYLVLYLSYFTMYQLYFFSTTFKLIKKYSPWPENQQFTPFCYGFLVGAIVVPTIYRYTH